MVVLCAAGIFALASLFSPQQGAISQWWRSHRWQRRERLENELKAIFRSLEDQAKPLDATFKMETLPKDKRLSAIRLQEILRQGFLRKAVDGGYQLTAEGQQAATRVVRNHRLWELYLARRASYPTDHVHDDAERMEHWLTDAEAQTLRSQLGNPTVDPHGRRIP
jgi:Mn-dependent DtxR family transcriptional regulator